jgi:hypothetical protein
MQGQHKNALLGWHPTSAEDAAWVRAEAQRRGRGALTQMLDEALALLRAKHEPAAADGDCPHPKARINKGLCGACGTYVGTTSGGK